MSQLRSPRRSPRLIAFTANCMVMLDTISSMVFRVGRPIPRIGSTCHVGFSPGKMGSQSGMRARRKKYVVKRAPKKKASLYTKRLAYHMTTEKRYERDA